MTADRQTLKAWHVLAPEDRATEVDIRFLANGDGTRVVLTHTG